MKTHNGMRPQDVLVLLKILTEKNKNWRNIDLANHVMISPSEVTEALNRNKIAGLFDADKRVVQLNPLRDFLIYGLKYVFPVIPGAPTQGIATAHSAYPIIKYIPGYETFVWPYPGGTERGQAIQPLFRSVPMIAKNDKILYELLVIIDTFRLGWEREVNLARRLLAKRLYAIQTAF